MISALFLTRQDLEEEYKTVDAEELTNKMFNGKCFVAFYKSSLVFFLDSTKIIVLKNHGTSNQKIQEDLAAYIQKI